MAAAERVFGLLPADQAQTFRALWDEFEASATPEARFARAADRIQPLLQRAHAGVAGNVDGITREQLLGRMAPVETALPELWPKILAIIETIAR